MSLSVRFLIAAGLVLLAGMLVVGSWVGERIRDSALLTLAETEIPHLQVPLAQMVRSPGFEAGLTTGMREALDRLAAELRTNDRIVSIKLWTVDGMLLYSSLGEQSQSFEVDEVSRAARGEIVASFEDLSHDESAAERALNLPLIEIYVPIYAQDGVGVLAVGEVYQDATLLQRQIDSARTSTWLLVGAATAAVLAVLFLIVREGSRTILAQEAALEEQVKAARALAAANEQLRLEADQARLDASRANEELLGRIGADLHDGPVQMLSLLLLSLPEDSPKAGTNQDPVALGKQVMAELRHLSAGLVLPEIEAMTLRQSLELAVSRHEEATGSTVRTGFEELPEAVPMALRVCLYRVVQESLNNSARHAKGADAHVAANATDEAIIVTIEDNGPGLGPNGPDSTGRLGLAAMRNRVNALRGHLAVEARADTGLRIRVEIPRSSNRGLA